MGLSIDVTVHLCPATFQPLRTCVRNWLLHNWPQVKLPWNLMTVQRWKKEKGSRRAPSGGRRFKGAERTTSPPVKSRGFVEKSPRRLFSSAAVARPSNPSFEK